VQRAAWHSSAVHMALFIGALSASTLEFRTLQQCTERLSFALVRIGYGSTQSVRPDTAASAWWACIRRAGCFLVASVQRKGRTGAHLGGEHRCERGRCHASMGDGAGCTKISDQGVARGEALVRRAEQASRVRAHRKGLQLLATDVAALPAQHRNGLACAAIGAR
jgi:hypothetical protein